MASIILLITLPLVVAALLGFLNRKVRDSVAITGIIILSILAIYVSLNEIFISFELSQSVKYFFTFADIALLLFFLWVGIRKEDKLVSALAITQLLLFVGVLFILPHEGGNDIVVDRLSAMMYLIINIVGGAIVIYALGYIETESFSHSKKNRFIAILMLFLGVMNLVVSTNNIEIFFLAFELTTLSSYLLIGYRQDALSIANSLKALWMNQVGGVVILLGLVSSIILYNTIYFDTLILKASGYMLLPIIFLIFAAFVKGASFPFQPWLLGAMVAPTPVSAILHSATMVKIAPFLILKLAPSFSLFTSSVVALFGGFVFMVASLMALNRDFFKEILALSTIALLALMMALAALGNEKATTAAMILIFFHAISKALLFLQAGVLEKLYHAKYISDINSLVDVAPKTIFFILVGFASLTLPPFGAFIGKFMAFEAISEAILLNPLYLFVLIFLIVGGIALTILYFKVASKLLAIDITRKSVDEKIPMLYLIPSSVLLGLLMVSVWYIYHYLGAVESLLALIIILILPLLSRINLSRAKQIHEYNCGEIDKFEISIYYFDLQWQERLIYGSLIFWVLLLIGGVL
ncbi:MAG: pesticidal protein Cry5Ba [Campylobacterales bacterium]|nr:pesticidal protein Cry5Ba [Campylobacterales bacterium]